MIYPYENLGDKITIAPLLRPMVEACAQIAKTAPDPWSAENLEAALEDPNLWCFVALLDQEPAGFACYLALASSADLQLLAVREDVRQCGIGRRLLLESLVELKAQGVNRCLLELRASNHRAVSLYEKFGFKRLAVRKGMYQNPAEDGYLMALGLGKG